MCTLDTCHQMPTCFVAQMCTSLQIPTVLNLKWCQTALMINTPLLLNTNQTNAFWKTTLKYCTGEVVVQNGIVQEMALSNWILVSSSTKVCEITIEIILQNVLDVVCIYIFPSSTFIVNLT